MSENANWLKQLLSHPAHNHIVLKEFSNLTTQLISTNSTIKAQRSIE